MRRDITSLRAFYASALGQAARTVIARKLTEAWGGLDGLDVLGLGYPAPYLSGFRGGARRVVAAMPAGQGVEAWSPGGGNVSVLADEYALPFANALFDRVLVIHALEEADDPAALLREVWRVTAPSGRIILAAANRLGFWSDAEATPFGHGRPFTRGQLESLAQDASLEPAAWSRALFAPPLPWAAAWADGFEVIGARLYPGLSGLILLEAVKHSFAVRRKGLKVPAKVLAPGSLNPAPAREAAKNALPTPRKAVAALEPPAPRRTLSQERNAKKRSPVFRGHSALNF